MSKFFRKSKKTFAVLLTIAFVLSMVAVPAFAATTYSSLTAPTVPDADNQTLGTISIEVDPIVDRFHEALVEVEDGWHINEVTINYVQVDELAPVADGVNLGGIFTIAGQDVIVGEPIEVDDDSFVIWVDTEGMSSIECRLQFNDVNVEDTGNIRAYFTGIRGQLVDGDVLIGRGQAGELQLTVREYDHFSDEGNVTIRVVEDVYGTFRAGETLRLTLPRGFAWNEAASWDTSSTVFGDVELVGAVADGREITFTFTTATTRSAIDLRSTGFAIQVDDPARASKGDVMAAVGGSYDATPDEIQVGVYGDYEYTVTPRDAETVYAGRVGQDIADITIAEDITETFVAGRSVTLRLPEWAKWGDVDETRGSQGVTLTLSNFYGRDGREAVYRVTGSSAGNDPAAIRLRGMEIVVAPSAPVGEDVVVEIAGSAGVRGEVVVGTVAAPATIEIDPITTIGIGRSNQPIGTITITEAEAEMFKIDEEIHLVVDRDVTWGAGVTVEVVEGDIELGIVRGAGTDTLRIPVEVDSEEPCVIQVTGSVTTLRTIPEGASNVRLRGPAIVETADVNALDDQWERSDGWYTLYGIDLVRTDNVFPGQPNLVVTKLAEVGVAAPPIVEPEPATVMLWIGSTTYTINGLTGEMDVAPFIEDDRTFVPVRFIAQGLGVSEDDIAWGPEDGLTEWVTIEHDGKLITINIGDPVILVEEDGVTSTVVSDVAAQIINDRTYLPLRAVGEILGAEFDWGPKESLTVWVSFTL